MLNTGQKENQVDDQHNPKEWTFADPLHYAPPEPVEDPWALLLEPLLKKDRVQCDAWKDEVQNLLIFAGLFSAVVTAFIVESYKTLQPDPNQAIISLLAHITTRLDGPSNSSADPFMTMQTFSPNASSIRINVFWFISLVLSLATVLVGIISLQWVREHQSYPDLSPRETYALFNMRDEGMKRWHVDKIFTALPLLLESALVLFLAGMIDFLHAFRTWSVIIPVAVVIGFTLLFLVSTTMLPTLQLFYFYFATIPENGKTFCKTLSPGQCPFKSPQSHALRRFCRPFFAFGFYILNHYELQRIWRRMTRPFIGQNGTSCMRTDHRYSIHLYHTSFYSKWIGFDKAWLLFRDTYARQALGCSTNYDFVRGSNVPIISPIYDIIKALQNQKFHTAAAYHCFAQVSESVLQRLSDPRGSYLPAELLCENRFISNLLSTSNDNSSILDFIDFKPYFDSAGAGDMSSVNTLASILHQQNLLDFTRSPSVSVAHSTELSLRFFRHFFKGFHQTLPNATLTIPRCFTLDHLWLSRCGSLDLLDGDVSALLSWQVADITLLIFRELVNREFHPHSLVHNPLIQSASLSLFVQVAAHVALKTLSHPALLKNVDYNSPCQLTETTARKFHDLFTLIDLQLKKEMLSWSTDVGHPSLFFYLAAKFTYNLTSLGVSETLTMLIDTISVYRRGTIDAGKIDTVVESRLRAYMRQHPYRYFDIMADVPFSSKWWASFDLQVLDYQSSTVN